MHDVSKKSGGFKGDPQHWQAMLQRSQVDENDLPATDAPAENAATDLPAPPDHAEFADEESKAVDLSAYYTERMPRVSMRERLRGITTEQWAFVILFALGAVLRLWGLADKPLHHDESLHAYFSLQFMLNPSSYQYDPLLHGPFQFHVIPLFFALGKLLGLSDNGVNDFTVRLLPAIMGMAMVAMPYWLRNHLGRWGALAMAFLLAVSPTFVYQSRYVRDDIYVTCCTLLLVVAALQYAHTRKLGWLVTGTIALLISYASMENTYFIIAAFGSFLAGLVLWDLGPALGKRVSGMFAQRDQPLAGRVLLLVPFVIVLGIAALFGLHWLGQLSNTINDLAAKYPPGSTNPLNPELTVKKYETIAVLLLLIVSILISGAVVFALLFQAWNESDEYRAWPIPGRRRSDPRTQPVLDTLLSTHWIRWFVGFVVAWLVFAAMFWTIPADTLSLTQWGQGFQTGMGRGLLHGLYYWLEQQHVARGAQPWYYYFILIPLYEQLALVFGLAGVVRALLQPNRFRIFLVYWLGVNVLLYSWAGEKMPWLVIHIMLPLIALAGVSLDWIFHTLVRGAHAWWTPTKALSVLILGALIVGTASITSGTAMFFAIALSILAILAIGAACIVEQWSRQRAAALAAQHDLAHLAPAPRWTIGMQQSIAAGSLGLAVLLLIPMLWNMQRLNFFEPSVAPNEMMVYVQTTTDVQLTMDKIDNLDRLLHQGKHTLRIGVTQDAVWPFAWYLRNYPLIIDSKTNQWTGGAQFNYDPANSTLAPPEVILGDPGVASQSIETKFPAQFVSHQYRLRWWWDESYKLPQCTKTKTQQCATEGTWSSGDGPLLWLSYGAFPPQSKTCANYTSPKCDPLNDAPNGASAAQRYWNWLWLRQNISGTAPGSTDFILYIRSDLTKLEKP